MNWRNPIAVFCLTTVILCPFVFGQVQARKISRPEVSARATLIRAIDNSKKSKDITVTTTGLLNNHIKIEGILYFVAPNRFHSKGVINVAEKNTIEIAGKRFDYWNGQWIHSRTNYYPLFEQLVDLHLPMYTSKKNDAIRIKKFSVSKINTEDLNGVLHTVFEYKASTNEDEIYDSGKAWVNNSTQKISRLETIGTLGVNESKSVMLFTYDTGLRIDAPSTYITKEWFSDR